MCGSSRRRAPGSSGHGWFANCSQSRLRMRRSILSRRTRRRQRAPAPRSRRRCRPCRDPAPRRSRGRGAAAVRNARRTPVRPAIVLAASSRSGHPAAPRALDDDRQLLGVVRSSWPMKPKRSRSGAATRPCASSPDQLKFGRSNRMARARATTDHHVNTMVSIAG